MKISVITLFPNVVESYFSTSMMWKAQKDGFLELELIDLRQFGVGPRKQVDDTVYGGGDGMLLKPEPMVAAIEAAKESNPEARVIMVSPQGKRFVQSKAQELSGVDMIFLCGRYEGFDERIREFVDEQISIGDYVLTGGELATMVIADAAVRLVPGVLGGEASAEVESFSDGETLEFPQYTRPEDFRGMKVPEVLLSGNHAAIEKWRSEQAKLRTEQQRQ